MSKRFTSRAFQKQPEPGGQVEGEGGKARHTPWKQAPRSKAFSNECRLSQRPLCKYPDGASVLAPGHSPGSGQAGKCQALEDEQTHSCGVHIPWLQPRARTHRRARALSAGGPVWAKGQDQYLLVHIGFHLQRHLCLDNPASRNPASLSTRSPGVGGNSAGISRGVRPPTCHTHFRTRKVAQGRTPGA